MEANEARQAVSTAISQYKDSHNDKNPNRIVIPWGMALDLAKLGHSDIGELSAKMWINGPTLEHLKELFGIEVAIDLAHEEAPIVLE